MHSGEDKSSTAGTAATPAVSVVIVSDYHSASEQGLRELRRTLASVAAQDFKEPVEHLLLENESLVGSLPADLQNTLPGVRVVSSPATSSYALKNHGARVARAATVAIVDGDLVLDDKWLSTSVAALRKHPQAAVVSARSLHAASHFLARGLALLERGYLDPGCAGATRYLGNHAAVYRRDVLLAHPFHETAGPFSSRLQSEAILRSGHQLWFEPSAVVFHAYNGWRAQLDIARNAGFGTVVTRQIDPRQPFATLLSLGLASIPIFVSGKAITAIADCVRCYPHYGIRGRELPLLLGLAVLARCVEVPGMWRALRGQALADTNFR